VIDIGERRKHIVGHMEQWAHTQLVYETDPRAIIERLIDDLAVEMASSQEADLERDIQPVLDRNYPLAIPPIECLRRRWSRT
jgi:hypothetical protein